MVLRFVETSHKQLGGLKTCYIRSNSTIVPHDSREPSVGRKVRTWKRSRPSEDICGSRSGESQL
jgi:hypothetical protein